MPQSQTAALPRPQATNLNKHKPNKRTKSTKISSHSVCVSMCSTVFYRDISLMRSWIPKKTEHLYVIWSCIRMKARDEANPTPSPAHSKYFVSVDIPRQCFCCSCVFKFRSLNWYWESARISYSIICFAKPTDHRLIIDLKKMYSFLI